MAANTNLTLVSNKFRVWLVLKCTLYVARKEEIKMIAYLAARYSRREELCKHSNDLASLGFMINSHWLTHSEIQAKAETVDRHVQKSIPIEGRPFAESDFKDIKQCDIFIGFSVEPGSVDNRGGNHVELGLALAWQKHIVIVGPRENVFHTLPQVRHFNRWLDARTYLIYWVDGMKEMRGLI